MKQQLIVTAHDFGLCASVNDGIRYVLEHKNNFVTELALLVNAPGSEEAARMAKETDMSVSLCLNLTTFHPIAKEVPSLVDAKGKFLRVDVETWDFHVIDQYHEDDIRKEIDAQVEWFIKYVGRKPSALLSRKNEHGDPKILIPFVEKAKDLGIPVRTPVWKWKENYGAQSYVVQEGVPSTSSVCLAYLGWKGPNAYDLEKDVDRFIDEFSKRKGTSELLVLTGFVDEELFQLSSVNWQRSQIFSILDRDDVIDKIRSNFDLVSYRSLS